MWALITALALAVGALEVSPSPHPEPLLASPSPGKAPLDVSLPLGMNEGLPDGDFVQVNFVAASLEIIHLLSSRPGKMPRDELVSLYESHADDEKFMTDLWEGCVQGNGESQLESPKSELAGLNQTLSLICTQLLEDCSANTRCSRYVQSRPQSPSPSRAHIPPVPPCPRILPCGCTSLQGLLLTSLYTATAGKAHYSLPRT